MNKMTIEKLIGIYETFFPGMGHYTRLQNDEMRVSWLGNNVEYIVNYSETANHLEVYKYDLREHYPLTTIIEGSPEDIIKLAKLLTDGN